MADILSNTEIRQGQEYSLSLTDASPDLFDEEYRIPYRSTHNSLEACKKIREAGGDKFTLFMFNMPSNTVMDIAGSALNQLSEIESEVELSDIIQEVKLGNPKAGQNVAGSLLFIGSGKEVDELAKQVFGKTKASSVGAKAVFDVSKEIPRVTVSQFTAK